MNRCLKNHSTTAIGISHIDHMTTQRARGIAAGGAGNHDRHDGRSEATGPGTVMAQN